MYLILANDSIEDFISMPDKREYARNADYFAMVAHIQKTEIQDKIYGWVLWYCIFKNKPLHVIVMSDRFAYQIIGNLINSSLFVNWKDMPEYVSEASEYTQIPHDERIFSDDKYIEILSEKIKNNNFRKKPYIDLGCSVGGVINEFYFAEES